MAAIDPDDDPLEFETEEFRELYAEDPSVADLVHAAVLAAHPERPTLADAVVTPVCAAARPGARADARRRSLAATGILRWRSAAGSRNAAAIARSGARSFMC